MLLKGAIKYKCLIKHTHTRTSKNNETKKKERIKEEEEYSEWRYNGRGRKCQKRRKLKFADQLSRQQAFC